MHSLQDESNDEVTSIRDMDYLFADNTPDLIDIMKVDDCHYCFINFQKDPPTAGPTTNLLHHLSRFTVQMNKRTRWDICWYFSSGNPIDWQ